MSEVCQISSSWETGQTQRIARCTNWPRIHYPAHLNTPTTGSVSVSKLKHFKSPCISILKTIFFFFSFILPYHHLLFYVVLPLTLFVVVCLVEPCNSLCLHACGPVLGSGQWKKALRRCHSKDYCCDMMLTGARRANQKQNLITIKPGSHALASNNTPRPIIQN